MAQRRNGPGREEQNRIRVAQEAARIMTEHGIQDFALAKRKAAERLGLPMNRHLPTNLEIEEALIVHQRLFRSHAQPGHLRRLRDTARQAMRLMADFQPRLVGPVLSGTADTHSPVNLHLFAETPEQVDLFLMDREIPHSWDERTVRLNPDQQERFPLCRFMAQDVSVEMTVFPPVGLRQAPLSPVDGRPMRRATLEAVEQMLSCDA
jgi:hypothetical protein